MTHRVIEKNQLSGGKSNSVTDLERFLPTSVQKSYFRLSDAKRTSSTQPLRTIGPASLNSSSLAV